MDFDSPWKQSLELYFQAFLALFFPDIHEDIDWSRGFEFLDKELQKIVRTSEGTRLYVDKLVKVWRKNGDEAWVLIHIEVQTQKETDFARRMYGYNTRIFHRYNRTVVSLAVLADDDPEWRPDHYADELWGWSVRMRWPPLKLLDYADRVDELESNRNPFARVVLAHLKTLETRGDPTSRRNWKKRLMQGLHEQGLSSEDVQHLVNVIDWLMELPARQERIFRREMNEYEEGRRMPYVNSFVRDTMLETIEDLLGSKFGKEGEELIPTITDLRDAEKYRALIRTIALATTLDEVRRAVAKAAAPARRPRKGGNGKRGASKK